MFCITNLFHIYFPEVMFDVILNLVFLYSFLYAQFFFFGNVRMTEQTAKKITNGISYISYISYIAVQCIVMINFISVNIFYQKLISCKILK